MSCAFEAVLWGAVAAALSFGFGPPLMSASLRSDGSCSTLNAAKLPQKITWGVRATNLAVTIIPFLGLAAAVVLLWGMAFDLVHLGLLVGMYLVISAGVTIGYHRLFTHRSFTTFRPIQWGLGILGSMALEGPLLKWVAQHRMHHQHSDDEGDPHSPHLHGTGLWQAIRGFWHAHTGWIFDPDDPDLDRYVGDLRKDPVLCWISRMFFLWAAVGLILPAILGGLLTLSWTGVLLGFLWGGLVRVFLVHHMTFSINSICHLWGARPFKTDDESRNNLFFGVLGLGEGWHNNHHAFPTSARHGLRWWQLDVSFMVIRLLGWMCLAWNIRLPSRSALESKHQRSVAARMPDHGEPN
jgi:stearoyl-CoA desaturase (Delta-9 desaturase)